MKDERSETYLIRNITTLDLLDNLLDGNRSVTEDAVPPSPSGKDVSTPQMNAIISTERPESRDAGSPGKDRYLVDVDVDVDGVMMDGLDQVEYYNRLGQQKKDLDENAQYYENQDGEYLLEDETGETEPISRTLEALALEGLGG